MAKAERAERATVPWWAYLIVGIVAVVVGLCVEAVVETRAPFGVSRRTYTYVADSLVPTSWRFADRPAVWAGVIAAAVLTIVGLVVDEGIVRLRAEGADEAALVNFLNVVHWHDAFGV